MSKICANICYRFYQWQFKRFDKHRVHPTKIDNHEKVIVGVNKYKVKEDITPQLQEIDEKETSRQVNRVKKYKKNRDQIKLKKSLDKLKKAAKSNDNIFKYIIDAIKANATLGEISDTLRQEFGEYA